LRKIVSSARCSLNLRDVAVVGFEQIIWKQRNTDQ